MIFSKRSTDNLKGVHPLLIEVMNEAIKNPPYDFTITEGVRSTQRQQELYAQGRTKPGTVVTNVDGVVNKSNHQPKADGMGYAVDLYPYVGGKVDVNAVKELKAIGEHIVKVAKAMKINVEWGGHWTGFKDYPHFQLN